MSKIKPEELKMPNSVEVTTRIPPYGDMNMRNGHIRINPKRGDVVNTIIHEKLHHNFPDMEHDKVYANAAKIESKMTLPEMARELISVHVAAQAVSSKTTPKATIVEVPKICNEKIHC